MKKVTTMVLMLCLILSGALCNANVAARTENKKKEGPILIIKTAQHGGVDKSGSITPSINDHVLSVLFNEDLGQVAVEITTIDGFFVDYTSTATPNGIQFYIYNAGDYVVNFTLPNGDEYYGEFSVTD